MPHLFLSQSSAIAGENKEIKANRLPDGWMESPKPLQQRDLDARWVKKNDYVWADSAYSGGRFKHLLGLAGFENRIHEKGSRNHPLSAAAADRNSKRSQTQAGVEHVFGCFATSMGGKFTRKIKLKKNKAWWSLISLTFNFLRYLYLSSNLFASI